MADENFKLELLLNKATSPALHDDDWDSIAAFCDQVNKEHEGPQLAARLLAHKIQSPTEREALSALSTVESCVKHCGVAFHKEIGKFKFLNETIKVLSPKFLGSRTTERVKKRCIELLYSWHKGLPHESKISEAYKMLKDQHIIKEDPTYMDKTFDLFPAPKPRRADFEDEEKAKELARLLKSKKANDLKAANKLIKELVKQDAEKAEKRSQRINELESLRNYSKLLTEMLENCTSNGSEMETMKVLYTNLEKERPKLFRLAGETEEQETDAMNEILMVNDMVSKAMLLYMKQEESSARNGETEGAVRDSSLLDIGFDAQGQQQTRPSPEQASGATAMLQTEFHNLGLVDSPEAAQSSNLGSLFASSQQQQQQSQAGRMSLVQAAMGAPGAGVGVGFPAQGVGFPAQGAPTTMMTTEFRVPPPPSASTVFGTPLTASIPPSPAFPSSSTSSSASTHPQYHAAAQLINDSLMEPSVFSVPSRSSVTTTTAAVASSVAPAAMADIDALGQSLLEKSRTKDFVRPSAGPPPKLTMNELAAAKTTAPSPTSSPQQQQATLLQPASVLDLPLQPSLAASSAQPSSVVNGGGVFGGCGQSSSSDTCAALSAAAVSAVGLLPSAASPPSSAQCDGVMSLADVFVPLESITPAEDVAPLTVYDRNSLKCLIHFSRTGPRPDVLVAVLSTLSTNVRPVKSFVFQAAVPKVMKVKLQPPSASVLPAFNPILPPAAITQILLIANPRKEKIRLKFKISYLLGEEAVSEGGDLEDFPLQ